MDPCTDHDEARRRPGCASKAHGQRARTRPQTAPRRLRSLGLGAITVLLAASTAQADLLPHITYTIDPPNSDLIVDTESDVQLGILANVQSSVIGRQDTGALAGTFQAAFGPSMTGGPGRVYFRNADLLGGALRSDIGLTIPLIALTGDVQTATRDIDLILDTTLGIPFAETVETTPGFFEFGPIDMVFAVDRTHDWNVDEQGGTPNLIMGSQTQMDTLFVTVGVSGSVAANGGVHDLSFGFMSADTTTLTVMDSVFLPSEGQNLDFDADLSVTALDAMVLGDAPTPILLPVPEPAALALSLASLGAVGAVARVRRRNVEDDRD